MKLYFKVTLKSRFLLSLVFPPPHSHFCDADGLGQGAGGFLGTLKTGRLAALGKGLGKRVHGSDFYYLINSMLTNRVCLWQCLSPYFLGELSVN